MSDFVIRSDCESRFTVSDTHCEVILEQLVAAKALSSGEPLQLLIVVAHPDDEAIGAGALLRHYPSATIAHLTDGGGVGEHTAVARGFECRADYATARRAEVLAALSLVGIPDQRVRALGIPDGEAGHRLLECCQEVIDLIDDVRPDVVLTHPYEGGHSDHDATAFAVHLAAGVLRREGGCAPIILELTSYHNSNGERVRGRFLPRDGVRVRTIQLDPCAQALKTGMFAAFTSQRDVVDKFPVDAERFRVAPRYLFTEAPHLGVLDYERFCGSITGKAWREMAAKALDSLRARRRTVSHQLD
ncbi:MAG: PIG-L deacetylase family protein [Gemmatimonadota bacterium]